MRKLIFANGNMDKLREIKEILAGLDVEILSMKEAGIDIDIVEDGKTFEENALIKARAVSKASGELALADDSGLVVDALGGEPGIYSARYMGLDTDEARRNCILEKLKGVEESKRKARFVCCICYIDENGNKQYAQGYWNGKIAQEHNGQNGFGYDPIFIPDGEQRTSAEMLPEEKNSKSHRANALKILEEILK